MTHWQQCTRLLGNTFTWQKAMVLWVKRLSATPVPYSKCTVTEGTLRQMISEVTTHSSHPLYPVVFSICNVDVWHRPSGISTYCISVIQSKASGWLCPFKWCPWNKHLVRGLCLMHLCCQRLDQTSTLHHPSVVTRRSWVQSLESPNKSHEGPLEKNLDLVAGPPFTLRREPEQLLIDGDSLQLFSPLDRSKSWLTATSGP